MTSIEEKSHYIDTIYNFKGMWDTQSLCGLKIVRKGARCIVIVSELFDSNPGTSVTTFSPQLATLITNENNIPPQDLMFIERAPDIHSKLEIYKESFYSVTFDWDGLKFTNPRWNRLEKNEVDAMIS